MTRRPGNADGGFTTRLGATTPCPWCGTPLTAATCMTERVRPKPGDVTICLVCAQVLEFDALLTPVKISPERLKVLPFTDPDLDRQVRQHVSVAKSLDPRH